MADNLELNVGSGGSDLATDDIAGVHFQRVKLVEGADGTNDGDVSSANPLPVETQGMASEDAAASGKPVLVAGRYDAGARTLDDGDAGALAVDADGALHISDGGNALTVDGTVTETNSAAIKTAVEAVQTAVEILDNAIGGTEMQVDVVASLPAGTNAIGKLAANSGVDIGDVDVASVPAPLNVVGGGTEAAALRVTVANDSTGVLSVDDAGGSLTVDNADLGTIAGDTTSLDGKVTACDTGAVTISAALPAGSNAVGKLAANSGVDIGDTDVTSVVPGVGATNLGKAEDAAHASGDVGVAAMSVRQDAAAALAGADGDYQPVITDANGRLHTIEASGATIAGDTTSIDGKITACNTGAVVLAASDGTDIGDVDVTSVPAPLNVVGGGTEAAALRVTVANDSTGVVSVDDGGGSLTVDAADLSTIAGDTTSLDGKVTACNTGAVVLAASDGTDIGDVDVASVVTGTGATNLGKAEDAAHSSGDVGVMSLAVRNDELASLGGADGDYVPLQTDAKGALYVRTAPGELKNFHLTPAASGATELIAAVASTAFKIHSLVVYSASDTANTIYFEEHGGTDVFGDSTEGFLIDRNGGSGPSGLVLNHNEGGWFKTTTANTALDINLSAAQGLIVAGTYSEYAA